MLQEKQYSSFTYKLPSETDCSFPRKMALVFSWYIWLLINIKVASNHMPTLMFSHLSPHMCQRFPSSKGGSEGAASRRPELSHCSGDKEQPGSPAPSLQHLQECSCVEYTCMILTKPENLQNPWQSMATTPLSKIPSQFQAWEPVHLCTYVSHCTHHLRY